MLLDSGAYHNTWRATANRQVVSQGGRQHLDLISARGVQRGLLLHGLELVRWFFIKWFPSVQKPLMNVFPPHENVYIRPLHQGSSHVRYSHGNILLSLRVPELHNQSMPSMWHGNVVQSNVRNRQESNLRTPEFHLKNPELRQSGPKADFLRAIFFSGQMNTRWTFVGFWTRGRGIEPRSGF